MGKKERKGKKKWAMIRVTEDVRKRLEVYKIQTKVLYSNKFYIYFAMLFTKSEKYLKHFTFILSDEKKAPRRGAL